MRSVAKEVGTEFVGGDEAQSLAVDRVQRSFNWMCFWTSTSMKSGYPRPINGIFVAITVRNCTLASRGRLAM